MPRPEPPRLAVIVRLIPGARHRRDRCVLVIDANNKTTRVRWKRGRFAPWRCDRCGAMTSTDCPHTRAAAVALTQHGHGVYPRQLTITTDPVKEIRA